jgi:translocation and assembly module TamB
MTLMAYFESEDFEQRAGKLALSWLSERLQRDVRVGDLDLDLYPLAITARDVVIGGDSPDAEPFASAEVVLLEATVGSFLRPGLTLDRIRIVRPEVTVLFDEEGNDSVPRWNRQRQRRPGDSRFVGEIGHLEVVDGVAVIDHVRYPLHLSARDLVADLVGGDGLVLRGRAAAASFETVLPGGRPWAGEVEVDATFERGRIDVRQARLSGPDLRGIVSGIWKWGNTRDVDLRIIADSRLEIFQRLGYLEGFGSGPFRFEGHIRRRPGEWFLDGAYTSPGATVLERRLAEIEGAVFGDQNGLRVEIESGRYGGGSLTGAVVLPFDNSEASPVEVDLKISGVDIGRLLDDQGIPVENLAADVSGDLSYRFRRPQPERGVGWADLSVLPVAAGVAEGVRISGDVPLSIRDGVVRVSAVRLVSEHQSILMDGEYSVPTRQGRFEVVVNGERMDQIPPLFGFPADEPELWQPIEASGTLRADIVVDGASVDTAVQLDLEDVEATGYSAERLQGRLQMGPRGVEEMRLELVGPGAAMMVSGSVPLDDPALSSDALRVSIDTAGWPLEDVREWLPVDLPFDGRFSGGVEIGGRLDALEGTVDGRFESVAARAVTVGELDLSLAFDERMVRVFDARLDLDAGELRGEGELRLEDGAVRAEVDSGHLVLARLPFLEAGLSEIQGSVSAQISVGGVVEEPEVHGVVIGHGIDAGARVSGSLEESRLTFDWVGGAVEVEGWVGSLVSLDGGGRLDGSGADLEMTLGTRRLGDLLRMIAGSEAVNLEGEARGVLEISAEIGSGEAPSVVLRIGDLSLESEGRRLRNLEPAVVAFESGSVKIESLYLGDVEGESELFFAGRVNPGVEISLDLDVQASLAASWFGAVVPGFEVRGGTIDVLGHVGGSVDELLLNGQGEIREARALIQGFPSSLDGLTALVLFYPDRVVLDRASAQFAGGSLEAGGTVDLDAESGTSYRFQMSGDDLNVRYPEGWLLRGDANLTLSSTNEGREISGVAELDSARYLENVQFLKGLFTRRRLEAGDVEPWRSDTRLDLVIEVPGGLEVSNNVADLRGSADLTVRGSLARPVIFGTVDLRRGGTLVYSGQEYTIRRGSLNFTNPYRIEPVLDLVATTEMREYDVTLSLTGTPDRLSAEFSSNPPLAELEVLALLTGSRDPQALGDSPRTASGDGVAAEGILYGQASSLIAGRFNRLFGLDQLRIDPLTSTSGDLSSARITVGKQLSRDLFVTYSYDPSQTEEQILELEWSLSRSLVLVLTQNGDGTYAVDARWEKAF